MDNTKQPLLPESVAIHALKAEWRIQYIPCSAKLELIEKPQQELALVGKTQDKAACKLKLVNWVKDKAKYHLVSQLHHLSQQTKLPFTQVGIRDQRTRWGSCTSDKSISLNYKLIFLPPHLVDHVLIHELCHTTHLNHSQHFWQLVAQHDPHWKMHKRALRSADQYIPAWLKLGDIEVK